MRGKTIFSASTSRCAHWRWICEHKPRLPSGVLFMTGDSGDQFVRAADEPRLRKPFTERELVDAVRELLGSE